MFDGMHHLWGMHWAGWIIWVAVIVGLVWLLSRGQRGEAPREARREPPLEILKRRYAEGEISTEEYEERKQRLQRME